MDAVLLARIQFAVTIAFHYIFPPLSIGLGLVMVILEARYLQTRKKLYLSAAQFWTKIFALIFSIGVASGIVMEFQFGTNWSHYSRYVGDVFGSALAAEGIFAFFLESGFLALLLFGWNRIGPKMHFFSTLMVFLGAMFSAVWIVVANSWMQTPAGYHIVTDAVTGFQRAEITDFWALVFNPSSVERLWHVLMGAWQSGAWLTISVGAWYMLKKQHVEFAKLSLKVGLSLALVAGLLTLVSGHKSAIGVANNQPAKLAAYEGHFSASAPAGLYLFGWVDMEGKKVHGVQIPGMLSWLVKGDTTAPVTGLDAFKPTDLPPVQPVFQAYHLMVAIGMTLIGLSLLGVVLWWRDKLWTQRGVLWVMVFAVILPQTANQLGWFAAEIGRQPWIVYGLMRTEQGVSRVVKSDQIMISLIMFVLVYLLLFALFIFLMDMKIKHGPEDEPLVAPGPGEAVPLLQGDRANV